MIAHASVELSHHVSATETTLPLTVDGKVVRMGVTASTRGVPRFKDFAEALKVILQKGILLVSLGPKFEQSLSLATIGTHQLDLPRVRRGEELRLTLSVPEPPKCSVVLTIFIVIEEGAKPALN